MKLSLIDVTELGLYLVLATFFGYLSLESDLVTPAWAVVLLGIGGIATVLLRQRAFLPAAMLALTLMVLSAAYGTTAETMLVLFTLLRAGVSQSASRAWSMFGISSLIGCTAALVLVFRLRNGPPILGLTPRADADAWPLDWLWCSVVFVSAALIVTLIGVNSGHRRRHIAALVERAEQMRRERDQQADMIRSLERERISREMHDVIAHSLSVMVALADGAKAAAPESAQDTQKAVGHIADTGRRTLGEVRRLLASVRGDGQSPAQPLLDLEQLPSLIDEFIAAGLPVRFERTGDLSRDSAAGLTVYRIVQESLTNVLRHGVEVRDVLVKIDLSDEEATILVQDTAATNHYSESSGRGLIGIRERVSFYDGEADAGPHGDGGWRVFARLRLGSDG